MKNVLLRYLWVEPCFSFSFSSSLYFGLAHWFVYCLWNGNCPHMETEMPMQRGSEMLWKMASNEKWQKPANWFEQKTREKCSLDFIVYHCCFHVLSCANCHGFGEKSNAAACCHSFSHHIMDSFCSLILMNEQPISLDVNVLRVNVLPFSRDEESVWVARSSNAYLSLTKEQRITKMKERNKHVTK